MATTAPIAIAPSRRLLSSAPWRALDGLLERPQVWLAAIVGLASLQLALILHHTPWLDEWQALLIAVQSPDWGALFTNLRYEGHPPLWYALLRGFAAFVPFELVLTVAAAATALALQALILLKAPFPRLERLLLAAGEIALFEYGTLARSLALGALAMLAAAVLWRRKEVWIALAVLPLCHFLFGVVALILIGLRLRERALSKAGLILFAVTSLLAAWSVRPADDIVPAEPPMRLLIELTDFLQRMGGLILPFQTYVGRIAWDGFPPLLLGGPLGAVFLIWMWRRFAKDPFKRAAVFGLIGLCLVMSVAIYPLHFRHLTIIAWLVVVLNWIDPGTSQIEQKHWRWWLALGAAGGLATAAVALSRPFDAAPQVAAAMARLDDGRTPWMAFPPSRIPPIVAQSRIPMVSPLRGCSQTFVRWNYRHDLRKPARLREALSHWADQYGRSFLILEALPTRVPPSVFQPLTGTMRGYDGQRYIIGVLAPDRPSKRRAFAPCVKGLRPLP